MQNLEYPQQEKKNPPRKPKWARSKIVFDQTLEILHEIKMDFPLDANWPIPGKLSRANNPPKGHQMWPKASGVPGIPRQGGGGGQATWTSKGGGCTVAGPGFAKKKGWAEKSVRVVHRVCAKRTARVTARASYGWGPGARHRAPGGVQGQSPCQGPRGRKLSSFQQIRAFKMVVRSDRNCNFSPGGGGGVTVI